MPGSFLDTNILIYFLADERLKADKADKLIADGGTISVQVLNEVANVARRKMRLSWDETNSFLAIVRDLLHVIPMTVEIYDTGFEMAQRHGFSIYDAMIVAAALEAGCETLWSEDMHDGLVVENRLRIINPFLTK
jgi:predicted nucleic acid-binding protein